MKQTDKKKEVKTPDLAGKTVEELKEIHQNLHAQLAQQQEAYQKAQTLVLKIQGAIEVVEQMLPKEEEK